MDPVRFTKTVSETEFYGMQYANPKDSYLSSGDTVTSATVVESSSGLSITSVSIIGGNQVAFYLAGGSQNNVYEIEVAAVTAYGRRPVRSFQLAIVPYVRAK